MAMVVLLIGSLSDRKVVKDSGMLKVLADVGVPVETHVMSAHRNAEDVQEFGGSRSDISVYIAAAAMATALPGAIAGASRMRKPVIGVPLDDYGVDSCIRMPPGVPVLTAGVGRAGLVNAAIAACQILATSDERVAQALGSYLESTARKSQLNVSLDEV